MKREIEFDLGTRKKTEHTTEANTEAMETLKKHNSRSVGTFQLENLTQAVEWNRRMEAGLEKVRGAMALLDDGSEEGQAVKRRMETISVAHEKSARDLLAMQAGIAGFYSSIIERRKLELPSGRHAISSSFVELSRRCDEIWASNDSFRTEMERLDITNTERFIEVLGEKELPLNILQAFLKAEKQRFEAEQSEMREAVSPIVEEFQTAITSERAGKYVNISPEVLERRIKGVDVVLLDSLDPAHDWKAGHYYAREFGIRSDEYGNSKKSLDGRASLHHIVFHELVHVTDGMNFLQTTTEYTDPYLADLFSPAVSVRQQKTGLSFDRSTTTSINEARVELLAAFLEGVTPVMYAAERMAFWELVDAGVSLETIYAAASENPDVYAPAGEKAPKFGKLAQEMSQFYGGPGALKRFTDRVAKIKTDPKLITQSFRNQRVLPA
ncbi:MAG: hypothetical protein WC813_04330 [Patescibacteria group bacterium]|jgi:hypothetical protein